jgi:hypothetical protein
MPRKRNPVPTYQFHKATGQAFVKAPDGAGGRKFVYLGKHGTKESQAEYERILAELRVGGREPAARTRAMESAVHVNQVLAAFLRHADRHYRRTDGTQTREYGEFFQIACFIRRLYGHKPASAFGPLALNAVREQFLASGWCRRVVNRRTNRIRHMFKWAAGEELVPGSVWMDLRAVDGLRAGRTEAPETEPVGPSPGPWSTRRCRIFPHPSVAWSSCSFSAGCVLARSFA